MIAEGEYYNELVFFMIYFFARSITTLLTPKLFMYMKFKKLIIICGIFQTFSGVFCIFTHYFFCADYTPNE